MSEQTTDNKVERNARKVREGLVVSDKMDKTVVVSVEDRVKHALYGKVLRRSTRLKAHDEANSCGVGDRVLLIHRLHARGECGVGAAVEMRLVARGGHQETEQRDDDDPELHGLSLVALPRSERSRFNRRRA